MTTAIIHGDPGSYKTSALVSDFLVPALKKGRVVVTNIRGVKSLEQIAEIYGCEFPDTAQVISVSFDPVGFEQMARFFHWAPFGAIILMDEGQRVYPTRLRDFSSYDLKSPTEEKRPLTVEEAFDTHRHYNWDIFISTPNIGKVHKEIRAVAEFGYRHKNMAAIFAFMKGRYKKVTHNAENSGTALSHEITSSIIKIDPRCFDVYESTSTGATKDTESAKSVSAFTRPKVQIIFLLFMLAFGFIFYRVSGDQPLPPMFSGVAPKPAGHVPSQTVPAGTQTPAGVHAGSVPAGKSVKNPFGGLVIYVVGEVNSLGMLFEVHYPDKSFMGFTQGELEQLGFVVSRLNSRMAKVTFESDVIFALPKPVAAYVADSGKAIDPIDAVF
jgi:zona occludens toxin